MWDGDWEGGAGRARLCPGTVRDGHFTVSGPESNQDGLPGTVPRYIQPVPHRDRVIVLRLPRFLSGTGSLPSLCPGTDAGQCPCHPFAPLPMRNGIPAILLSRYRTGWRPCRDTEPGRGPWYPCAPVPGGTSSLLSPPAPHPTGPTPAHFPSRSLPPVATTPGVPRVPRSAPSLLQGFPEEPLIRGLRGSMKFTGRAGQWAPSRECCGARQRRSREGFVTAGSRTTPRECSPKRHPEVGVSRCHSSPAHPRARTQRRVIQSIILRGPRWGLLEAEYRYVPQV